ncbi:MAG: glycoside hydrolase family 16 protein [Candidatus Eremiobacteraeota bacterium]|nr:glycoside hydrolase family 16 protein [Candidatus Eremiobacteraeota bacterium]
MVWGEPYARKTGVTNVRYRLPALTLVFVVAGCASNTAYAPNTGATLGPTIRGLAPRVLLDQEFNGGSLDKTLWYTCYPWAKRGAGCSNNPGLELEWYEKANVSVGGGNANLVALHQSAHHGYPFTSGMISTGGTPHSKATFSYLYGYAEARIKLPPGRGMWPAFWLVPANRSWPPEIDIMEWQGVAPKDDIVTIHWGTAKHPQSDGSTVDTGVNLATGFHTYGLDWQPNAVTWYFDGKAIKRYAQRAHIPRQPMYVILNLAIGGWLPGQLHPRPNDFPATMLVDYVKIWSSKP